MNTQRLTATSARLERLTRSTIHELAEATITTDKAPVL